MTRDQGRMTEDGIDLLTVVMHELGHLLGLEHRDDPDNLMAPVLGTGVRRSASRPMSDAPNLALNLALPLSNSLHTVLPSSARRPEAGAARGPAPSGDDVDRALGEWAGEAERETRQPRLLRRSRMQRLERELDAWFAELAAT